MPRRIASLLSAATEMLFALGLGERVVAVSHECDWPPEATGLPRVTTSHIAATTASAAIDSQVRELAASGRPLYGLDVELLGQLSPDLIVTQQQCDVCAVSYNDVLSAVANDPRLAGCRVRRAESTIAGRRTGRFAARRRGGGGAGGGRARAFARLKHASTRCAAGPPDWTRRGGRGSCASNGASR